jgi:putative DNA primase/helicase
MTSLFNRPGVSDAFLSAVGCHHVGADECVKKYGCRAEGIAIPFRTLDGRPVSDSGKPFARIRLYRPTATQKYHQRAGSETHVYLPQNLAELPRSATTILTEGEFKALALAEAGFFSVGLCGICGAVQTVEGEPRLHDELAKLLEFQKPVRVLFLADSDAVLNADFSREVSKLHKTLFNSKCLQFVEELRVAVCPLGGPKGVDDVRATRGDQFNAWFNALVESSFLVPRKASPAELFCSLLHREIERAKTAITGDSHDAHQNLVKLLQSAGRLKSETGAMLKLKPLLAHLLGKKESAIAGLIRDAGRPAEYASGEKLTERSTEALVLEPWPDPVIGTELVTEISCLFKRFVYLPVHAAVVLAFWVLQTWSYELFDFAAIIAVWSPEDTCGKGRVLDVTAAVARNPFRTSNTSAAVLYHVIAEGQLTVLVDEMDSISDEQRAAICNILKGGFQSNGRAHRMTEKNGEQVVVEFPTYCPKMVATIHLDKLDKATRSRTIGIRMQRKPRSMELAKFRRVDCSDLRRKCLRWVQDYAQAIKSVPPLDVEECNTDRQEDVWEPLIAIARVVGGDWEARLRQAAQELTNSPSDGASATLSHQLLVAFADYFSAHGDRVSTKAIVAALNEIGDFADVNYGRGLNPQFIAKHLKPYGIESRTIKLPDGSTAKGYIHESFDAAFSTYLPKGQALKGNPVTEAGNIGESPDSEKVTKRDGDLSENVISHNNDGQGDGVTFPEPQKDSPSESELDL